MLCFFEPEGFAHVMPLKCIFIGDVPARRWLGWARTAKQRLHITLGSPVFSCATWSKQSQTLDVFCLLCHWIDFCKSSFSPNSVFSHHSTKLFREISILGSIMLSLKRIQCFWRCLPTRWSDSGALTVKWGRIGGRECSEKEVVVWPAWLEKSKKSSDCRISGSRKDSACWDTEYWLSEYWDRGIVIG